MAVPLPTLDGPDKHEEYWFESGDLVLLVDEVYFKVHRDLLARASGTIKDMLAMPVGEDPSRAEGNTISNAISIPDVPYQHFEAILQAVYGRFIPEFEESHLGFISTADGPDDPDEPDGPEGLRDPTFDDAIDLLRIAHRLQVPSVVIPLAQATLPHLRPVQRFTLCHDLGLDDIRFASEQERSMERLSFRSALEIRAKRRGARCQWTSGYARVQPGSQVKTWLMEAFIAVVLAKDVQMPSSELGDRTSLHVVLARQRLSELRASSVGKWASPTASYKGAEVLWASKIWRLTKDNVKEDDFWGTRQSQSVMIPTIRNAFPSYEEEVAVIKSHWESAGI